MIEATKDFLAQQEELYAKRKEEILNAKDELVILANPYWLNAVKEDPDQWSHEMLIRSGIKLKYPKKKKRAAC